MKYIVSFIAVLLLAACSSTQVTPELAKLPSPAQHPGDGIIAPDDIFELPSSAKKMLREEFKRYRDLREAKIKKFVNWMGTSSGYPLAYDSGLTYTASEMYAEGEGNCLSMAILTTAFARALRGQVSFIRPLQEEAISSADDHVFVVLAPPMDSQESTHGVRVSNRGMGGGSGIGVFTQGKSDPFENAYGIQFMARGHDKHSGDAIEISEQEIVSIYYRQKAQQALANNKLEQAYSYAYAAVNMAPEATKGYALLGKVLEQRGNSDLAKQMLAKAAELKASQAQLASHH